LTFPGFPDKWSPCEQKEHYTASDIQQLTSVNFCPNGEFLHRSVASGWAK